MTDTREKGDTMKLSLLGVEVDKDVSGWTATLGSLTAHVECYDKPQYLWWLRQRDIAPDRYNGGHWGGTIAQGVAPGKAAARRAVNEAAHAYLEEEEELREWHRSRNSPNSAYDKGAR